MLAFSYISTRKKKTKNVRHFPFNHHPPLYAIMHFPNFPLAPPTFPLIVPQTSTIVSPSSRNAWILTRNLENLYLLKKYY